MFVQLLSINERLHRIEKFWPILVTLTGIVFIREIFILSRASRSGVTPFAQAPDVYNGDWKSILRVFQLGRKESVECYCTEKHVSKHGVTFDWLLHTHG